METHRPPGYSDPETYLTSSGIEFHRTSTNQLRFDCPFCDPRDTGGHCYMDARSGQYTCHKCAAKGNLRTLQRRFGDLPVMPSGEESSSGDRARILEATAEYCASRLGEEPTSFLESRCITPETAARFRVGYDDGGLTAYLTQQIGVDLEVLEELGLTNEQGNDAFYRRVVFPNVVDERLVHLSGRSLDAKTEPRWRHVTGSIDHLYNEDALRSPEVIVTEGILCCLTVEQWGLRGVCTYGTGTAQKLGAKLASVPFPIVAMDSDEAGRKAARALAEKFCLSARLLRLPDFEVAPGGKGKDINELLTAGWGAEEFRALVHEAVTLPELLASEIPADVPKTQLRRLLDPALPALSRMPEVDATPILRHSIAKRFNLTERDLKPYDQYVADLRKRRLADEKAEAAVAEAEEAAEPVPAMSEAEVMEAEELLDSPDLIDQILADVGALGQAGERRNVLLTYMAMTSRKADRPINVELRAGTTTGKSHLVGTVASLMAPEDVVDYTRVTTHYLDYLDEDALAHKVLILREAAGGEAADLGLRMLTDDTAAESVLGYVAKDEKTGQLVAKRKVVKGPIAHVQTSTRTAANPENESRLWVLSMDESKEQRRAVHGVIKQTHLPHEELTPEEREVIQRRHRNAQQLLKPIPVAIPYARLIDFPAGSARTTRDLKRFLSLIGVSALLHQRQRRVKVIRGRETVLAEIRDYEIAHDIAAGVIADSAYSLPPQSRSLLETLVRIQAEKEEREGTGARFTRQDACRINDWGKDNVHRAIQPLERDGYLDFQKSERPRRYRLVRTEPVETKLEGLLTPDKLRHKIAENREAIHPIYLDRDVDDEEVAPEVAVIAPDVAVIAGGDGQNGAHTRLPLPQGSSGEGEPASDAPPGACV